MSAKMKESNVGSYLISIDCRKSRQSNYALNGRSGFLKARLSFDAKETYIDSLINITSRVLMPPILLW
jgi:hypothetical protein